MALTSHWLVRGYCRSMYLEIKTKIKERKLKWKKLSSTKFLFRTFFHCSSFRIFNFPQDKLFLAIHNWKREIINQKREKNVKWPFGWPSTPHECYIWFITGMAPNMFNFTFQKNLIWRTLRTKLSINKTNLIFGSTPNTSSASRDFLLLF